MWCKVIVASLLGTALFGCGSKGCTQQSINRSQLEAQEAGSGYVGQLGKALGRHAGQVTCLTISRDGELVASGDLTGTLRIWDAATLECRLVIDHPAQVWAATFSADNSKILSICSEGILRTWNLHGELVHSSTVSGSQPTTTFSADGLACVSANEQDSKWHVRYDALTPSGHIRETRELEWPRVVILGQVVISSSQIALSPDKRWVAAIGMELTEDGEFEDVSRIYIWDLKNANSGPHTTLSSGREGYKAGFTSVAFSPDSMSVLAGNGSGELHVWAHSDSEPRHTVDARDHAGDVTSIQFSPDGKLLATGGDDTRIAVRKWPADKLEAPVIVRGHEDRIPQLRFSSDGSSLFSCSADHTVRRWERTDDKFVANPRLAGHTHEVLAIAFSPDGRTIATGASSRKETDILLWKHNGANYELDRRIEGLHKQVSSLRFISSQQLVAADSDSVRGWTLEPFKEIPGIRTDGKHPIPEAIEAGRQDGVFYCWWFGGPLQKAAFLSSGLKAIDDAEARIGKSETFCVSPTKSLLATAYGNEILFLDAKTLQEVSASSLGEVSIEALEFSSNGQQLAVGARDGSVYIIAADSGKTDKVLRGHDSRIVRVAYSLKGKILATSCADGRLCIWDLGTGKITRRWELGRVSAMTFRPDGRVLAVGDSAGLVWLLQTTDKEADGKSEQ